MIIKNKTNLIILAFLAKIGLMLKLKPQILVKYFSRGAIIAQLENLFLRKKFPYIEKTDNSLDILFLAYLGAFQGNNIVQVTLAKILEERGHRIRFVLCDIELPLCETTDISNHYRRSLICQKQLDHLKLFFKKTGFEIIWLTDLIPKSEIDDLKNEVNISNRWDSYVESILLRYFKVGIIDETNQLVNELRNRANHAALISEKMGSKIADLNPDRVFFSHGTYTTRGPAKEVLNERNIPIVSISRGKMAESQKFNWKTAGDWWDINYTWNERKSIPLITKEKKLIDNYLLSRRNHDRDIIVYNFSPEESKVETLKKLNLDVNKKVFTLFTNVLWDAASAQREVAFKNPIEWTIETINWFKKHPEKQLVVRIHPAEGIIGTNQAMENIILDRIPNLPENITIIKPKDSINSWSLLKITDFGLVHTSTVGLELALEGIPCICVSRTHYRDKGFTIDITSKEEYFKILKSDNYSSIDIDLMKELSLKYAYILFMQYQLQMPFYLPETHISINSFKSLNWNSIVDHLSIKQIIKSTEEKIEFIMSDIDVFKVHKL